MVRPELAAEKPRQKTYYDSPAYGPTYSEGEQVLVFFLTLKKPKTKRSRLFTRDLTPSLRMLTIETFASVKTE